MGLDSVELVMAFEEEFAIAIPNDAAPRLPTIGDVSCFAAHAGAETGARSRVRARP